jgi:hypothetical protein
VLVGVNLKQRDKVGRGEDELREMEAASIAANTVCNNLEGSNIALLLCRGMLSRNKLFPAFLDLSLSTPVGGLEDAETDLVVSVRGGVAVEKLISLAIDLK